VEVNSAVYILSVKRHLVRKWLFSWDGAGIPTERNTARCFLHLGRNPDRVWPEYRYRQRTE